MDDHLDELAHHYSRSDNVAKAVEYLGRAGRQALQRSAYVGAVSTLSAAINLLQKLPDSPERIHRELLLQLAVGPALIAVKGFTAPEVERAYVRAQALCDQLGDPAELFPTLVGLWIVYHMRGHLPRAHELAKQLLRLALSKQELPLLLYARQCIGITSFYMGELISAREHLEMVSVNWWKSS